MLKGTYVLQLGKKYPKTALNFDPIKKLSVFQGDFKEIPVKMSLGEQLQNYDTFGADVGSCSGQMHHVHLISPDSQLLLPRPLRFSSDLLVCCAGARLRIGKPWRGKLYFLKAFSK